MKKLIIFLTALFLLMSSGVIAADVEVNGGITYNSFAGAGILSNQQGTVEKEFDKVGNGYGLFIEGLYPVREKLYLGLGYDYVVPAYHVEDIEMRLISLDYRYVVIPLTDEASEIYRHYYPGYDNFKADFSGFRLGAALNYTF